MSGGTAETSSPERYAAIVFRPTKPSARAAATVAATCSRRAGRSRPRAIPSSPTRSIRITGAERQPASTPIRSQPSPSPGAGKPSSISSHSVPVARSSVAAYASGSVARRWAKTASSVGSQPSSAASVAIPRRYVRPVATCGHWRGSSLSENRPRNSSSVAGGRDDPVRVVVDERDLAQYFSKCPCCANASSSAA